MTSFADSIFLDPAGENLWRGEVDPAYKGFGSQFGGWTAAALLKGVMVEPDTNGDPLSLSVLFLDAIGDGPTKSPRACSAPARACSSGARS